ncbi:protein-glutamine gamma-glutamyltransferase K-like [Argopecten irradians]|uniref:protein-glutamine gamma-glutamyltransferase K-like n=1 Tax=Argopecten irradians TaxID=31199 RepID=UPI003710E9C5
MVVVAVIGSTPQPTKGTLVQVPVSEDSLTKHWGAKVVKRYDYDLQLEVMTPPFCAVGRWNINVRAVKKGADSGSGTKVYSHPRPIYILFNPWCKDDQVYHHNNGLLDEYVMNETGKIFVGDSEYITGRYWSFDQFEDPVLDCVLDLLDQKGFPASSRDDPVKVARKLSALVNSSDDRGVLTGNWSGNYTGGKKPTAWTGSHAILEEYHKTKSPVKFGQCWVFSGVLTTCCRTLGIPTRSVTNFNSAHNTDTSNTIDVILDEYGMPMDEYNSDSVWNFHVWNDVWMARPDLGSKDYGGWQALDSTPQETSDGLYCCGPCPLLAIKKGDVTVPYDGHFIYCEVNADRVYWKIDNATLKMYKMETDSIGKRLSTHRPRCLGPGELTNPYVCRDKSWQEITDQYKYPEGSGAERAAVYTSAKWGHMMGLYGNLEESKAPAEVGDGRDVQGDGDLQESIAHLSNSNVPWRSRHRGLLIPHTLNSAKDKYSK